MMIALLGFMASGKSTLGPQLAAAAGLGFQDLDEAIVTEQGQSVARIFADRGEAAWRDIESETLARLAAVENKVLATGGGVVERAENRQLLRSLDSVYLYWPWESLWRRLARDRSRSRPLLIGGEKTLHEHWQRRELLYRQSARCVYAPRSLSGKANRRGELRRQAGEILALLEAPA